LENVPASQYLFAYGTLRSDQPERDLHGPASLGRSNARVPGTLYQLEEGYPILHIPKQAVLCTASHDWKGDRECALALLAFVTPNSASLTVKGEVIETPLERNALLHPDRWEGFRIGSSSVYQRVALPAALDDGTFVPAWAYICLDVPRSATLIHSGHWERPQDLA